MSPEKTKKLFDRFPKLYCGKTKPITESLMMFGFECGDGWFDLIAELSQRIDDIAKATNMSDDDYPEAMQVKEKFGGLRFYIGPSTDEVFAAIDEAEAKSVKVCETCGKPGRQVNSKLWPLDSPPGEPISMGGMIVTICEACEKTEEP